MEFYISNSSDKPIYEQIMTQIKSQILSGALKEGDALPSIRVLARELRISVITTKRAYDEPVSYTHLDVYKRQLLYVRLSFC